MTGSKFEGFHRRRLPCPQKQCAFGISVSCTAALPGLTGSTLVLTDFPSQNKNSRGDEGDGPIKLAHLDDEVCVRRPDI
eukprot:455059-Rhodomonas_salina.7